MKKYWTIIYYHVLSRIYWVYNYIIFLIPKIRTIINVNFRKYYQSLSEEELKLTKKSDTVFIFGSGGSIRDITDDEWKHFEQYDTLAFNMFIKNENVRVDYHLVREMGLGDRNPKQWRKDISNYTSIIKNNPKYENTIFLVQKELIANSNRILGKNLFRKGTNIFFFKTYKRTYTPIPGDSFKKGLIHYAGTLSDVVNFAFLNGWKNIVLVGIDLYDRKYFWLDENETRYQDLKRNVSNKEIHNTVSSGIIELIDEWNKYIAEKGVNLYIYNPKSLLVRVLTLYNKMKAKNS